MLIYVAHEYGGEKSNIEKAAKLTHDLQVKDLENCYICPLLTFSHLVYGEIGTDAETALCLDVLSICDTLIVASSISDGVRQEIEFANLVGMEVVYLEEEKYDP